MNDLSYPLAASSWDDKETEAMKAVMETGMHSMGKNVREYEEKFAEWLGSKYCVMVNSGSSANLIGSFALKYHSRLKPQKKKIIVPAVSWSTTYFPLNQAGFTLSFVDIDKETLNINMDDVEKLLQTDDEIYGVCAVNLLGNPCYLSDLKDLCDKYNVVLIEDNCESLGAMENGKKTGTVGEFGSFSFFFSHHLCTMEGGMIATDDEELYHIMLSLRAHGWTREVPNEKYLSIDCHPFEKKFRFLLPGFNLRPIEMEAAVGLVQLSKADEFIKIRRENAQIFNEHVAKYEYMSSQKENDFCSYFGYAITFDESIDRNGLADFLEENNIETRPILAGNFLHNPVLEHLNYEAKLDYSNSEFIDKHGLFFGSHNKSLELEFKKVFKLIEEFVAE